jgi:hypothetical protein
MAAAAVGWLLKSRLHCDRRLPNPPPLSHAQITSQSLNFSQHNVHCGGRMSHMVPKSATQILERSLDTVRIRANANGECFGGEIADALREAGASLGVDRLEVLLTRTILARVMESLGENYPAEVLQDYENRMPVSKALKYLEEAIVWLGKLKTSELGSAASVSCE